MGPSGLKFHAKGHGSSTWRSSGYHPGWKRPPRVKFLMGRGQAADLVCSLLICENYVAACRIASNSVDLFRFFFTVLTVFTMRVVLDLLTSGDFPSFFSFLTPFRIVALCPII